MMFGYGMHGVGGLGMGFGLFGLIGAVFQLLILAAVVYLIVYAIRAYSRNHRYDHDDRGQGTKHARHDVHDEALRILAERFARGEISADEYRTMKEELK